MRDQSPVGKSHEDEDDWTPTKISLTDLLDLVDQATSSTEAA